MKIKVCGLTDINQMWQLSDALVPINESVENTETSKLDRYQMDFIGINFYTASPRYYKGIYLKSFITNKTKKVGIFVNEDADTVIKTIQQHGLDYAQLHGDETPAYCALIASHAHIIKAFPHYILTNSDTLSKYKMCELFLFDTASLNYGGSGKKFDWSILDEYEGQRPYLLAGGIDVTDIDRLTALDRKNGFLGIDINSKFEKKIGIKDIQKIITFTKSIRNE